MLGKFRLLIIGVGKQGTVAVHAPEDSSELSTPVLEDPLRRWPLQRAFRLGRRVYKSQDVAGHRGCAKCIALLALILCCIGHSDTRRRQGGCALRYLKDRRRAADVACRAD